MKLFISSKLWRYRGNEMKVVCLDKKRRSKLVFSNLKADDNSYESLEFILPIKNYKLNNTEKNLTIDCSRVRRRINGYEFELSKKDTGKHVYALLCCGSGGFLEEYKSTDIYIPVDIKEKIEIFEKIQFCKDLDAGTDNDLPKVYLVRISLSKMESIPFYLTSKNPTSLKRHLIFRRDELGRLDVDEYKTCILLNPKNQSQYVSLSNL